ncbi:hypothetical protein [Kitasatospora fiedleri]|uniref:hypothetical protein n=1 Tax=Kitasatospora fiedleri TaxID=2991545 RepID=UPI00249C22C9|nr:hypothetical protein [Kitasatospora fiedleri]
MTGTGIRPTCSRRPAVVPSTGHRSTGAVLRARQHGDAGLRGRQRETGPLAWTPPTRCGLAVTARNSA